jgi:tRNA threonylcarbamoyladenosine biosynthesis protein TsaB
MISLAFDTCLGAVSAAVHVRGRVAARFELCPTGHAERLLPVITDALGDAGVSWTDVTRIAVTLGPGGFTGVRVGISAARAFSLALGVPVVGVSSLELLARGVAPDRAADVLAAAAPAGRAGVYVQMFRAAPFAALGAPRLLGPDDEWPELATATAIGPGASLLETRVSGIAAIDAQPNAAVLATLSVGLQPLDTVRPIYLRAADAKPQVGRGLAHAVDSRQT